jgi:hypothetical protein
MYRNAYVNTTNINAARKKLPQYLLVSDLAQLKENELKEKEIFFGAIILTIFGYHFKSL